MRVLRRSSAVLLAGAAAVAVSAWWVVSTPYSGFSGEKFVEIPLGLRGPEIADLLAREGIVRTRYHFLVARVLRPKAPLQAGEYRFDHAASPWEVLDRLRRGDVFLHLVTIPEGHNLFEVARLLEGSGLMTGEQFLAAARDPAMIADLAPDAATLEGYLFPDTYAVARRESAVNLCRRMTARFRQVWRELGGSETDAQRWVTIASLVEKETGIPSERPLVASVIANRLSKNMPLQIDPTVIYAAILGGDYHGGIRKRDLARKHPYNTYQNPGLPPGPIANPGRAALEAALHPAHTKYLYFVARPDESGAHVFSEDLKTHERAVRLYRNGTREANKKEAPG